MGGDAVAGQEEREKSSQKERAEAWSSRRRVRLWRRDGIYRCHGDNWLCPLTPYILSLSFIPPQLKLDDVWLSSPLAGGVQYPPAYRSVQRGSRQRGLSGLCAACTA